MQSRIQEFPEAAVAGRLLGKVALVTGGGTGIGLAVAEEFARQGASVVVAGRRPEPLADAVESIRKDGGTVTAAAGDVGRSADTARLVAETVDAYGRIDVLINNAGQELVANLLET